jgi:hypothetical protein
MEADVIRWKEALWEKRQRLRGRAVNAGDRMVVAEVLRDADGWVELLVRECTIVSEKPGWLLKNNGERERRKEHGASSGAGNCWGSVSRRQPKERYVLVTERVCRNQSTWS